MPDLSRISGSVVLPDGSVPYDGRIHFTPAGWDSPAVGGVQPPATRSFTLGPSGGLVDVYLSPSTTSMREMPYRVSVTHFNVATRAMETTDLGLISVPEVAEGDSVSIRSLLSDPGVIPTAPDALAQVTAKALEVDADRAAAQAARTAAQAAEAAAEASAATASTAAANALAAEVNVETAFANANVYDTLSAGRASVADGGQFIVAAAGATEFVRYRRDSSTTQTEMARYPRASRVDDLHERIPAPFNATLMPPESGYVWAVLDAADRLGAGITPDGRLDFVPADGVPQIFPPGVVPATLSSESGWLDACEDASGRVGYGLRVDGTFWARLADDCPVPSWAGGTPSGLLPNADIVCWGDSMTAGSGASTTAYRYPQALAIALGRSVANRGIGGQQSNQIAGRQGGLPVAVTVSGNSIPASGAVSVTAISPAILNSGSSSGTLTGTGTLAGVHGTLSKTGNPAVYTFTRTAAGSVTACPAGSVYTPDEAAEFEGHTVVIWAGRNDDRATRAAMIATRDNILAMMDRLTPLFTRVLVLPIFNGRAVAVAGGAYEPSGSTAYANIMLANEELARTLGDRFLGGLRDYMVRYAALDLGLTLTADDLSDIAADCIPRQLFSDDLHLNDYRGVANYVARAIRARGW